MTVAIPVSGGLLASHFGHSESFVLFSVQDQTIGQRREVTAPAHRPGAFPRWLKEQGVDLLIAAGIGRHAQELLEELDVTVVCGAFPQDPEEALRQYLAGSLETGDGGCDHHHHGPGRHQHG
jgi:ATP-binding protein involved in chromosome partitioning